MIDEEVFFYQPVIFCFWGQNAMCREGLIPKEKENRFYISPNEAPVAGYTANKRDCVQAGCRQLKTR